MRKKFVVMVFLTQLAVSGCQADTFHYYKDEIAELTRDPKTRKIQGNENDVNDLNGCPVPIEFSKWHETYLLDGGWGRDQSWIDGSMISEKLVGIRTSAEFPSFLKQPNMALVYVGPWYYVKKIGKEIRLISYQDKNEGVLWNIYEGSDEKSKLIPEKQLSLVSKSAPAKSDLCVTKWTARFGYNAIAEVKSKNPFSKNYLVPTGKIIEAKE